MKKTKFSKVKSIKRLGKEKVYDLTVKDNHNFYCNGVLVHNCDYRGEVMVILKNDNIPVISLESQKNGNQPDLSTWNKADEFLIKKGERIAQAIIKKVERIEWDVVDSLDDTERGEGGFGHTGR